MVNSMMDMLYQTEHIETVEGPILIAMVGIDDDSYHKICNKTHQRVGYGLARVSDISDLDAFEINPEVILVSENLSLDRIPNDNIPIMIITTAPGRDGSNALSISNEINPLTGSSFIDDTIDQFVRQALVVRQKKLFGRYEKELEDLLGINGEFDEQRLMALFREKDSTTYNHIQGVVNLSETITTGMLELGEDFSREDAQTLRTVALIHDVGKLFVPDQLIKNNDAFSKNEFDEMKRHVELNFDFAISERMQEIIALAEKHHFRYGGGGYLKQTMQGDDIPLISRMITVVDSFDAITATDRVYQNNQGQKISVLEKAINILYDNAQEKSETYRFGGQFDPLCSKAFLVGFNKMFNENETFRNYWLDRDGLANSQEERLQRENTIKNLLETTIDKFNINSSNKGM